MKDGAPYYKPKAYYVEAIDKWSEPKWHIRANREETLFAEYDAYGGKTLCGIEVRRAGTFTTHRPIDQTTRCRKCFGNFKGR